MGTRFIRLLSSATMCMGLACDSASVERTEPVLGTRSPAIIGGQDETAYPAVGALVSQSGFGRQSFCTGSLIRPGWVLTAAHCVDSANLNSTAFFIGSNASGQGQSFAAAQFYIHPRYTLNPAAALHDIALMRLAKPVPANVATPYAYNDDPLEGQVGKAVTFVGFGVSDGLRKTGGGRKRRTSVPIDRVDAITFSTSFEGTGVCFGDSGGPGLLTLPKGERVISVNSTVNGCVGDDCDPCKGLGGNYTRVDVFAEWIASVLGEPFESCAGDVSACACPGACQKDGLCDNAVCTTVSCASALDCILDDCNGGQDGSCAQACVQRASLAAQARLGELIDCAATGCETVEGAEANRTCLAERCPDELSTCEEPAGQKSCADAQACTLLCAAGDAACASACAQSATIDGQVQLAALLSCRDKSCSGLADDALAACLAKACPQAYDGCFPPDHCALGMDSCPAGRVCAETLTGSTQCQDAPVEPEPIEPEPIEPEPIEPEPMQPAPMQPGPVDGSDAGDGNGGVVPATDNPNANAGGAGNAKADSSDGGCSVSPVSARAGLSAYAWAIATIGALGYRRRRGAR